MAIQYFHIVEEAVKLWLEGKKDFTAVSRWTKTAKLGGKEILDFDNFVFPANVGNRHWILICMDVKRGKLFVLDSMKGPTHDTLTQNLLKWYEAECRAKKRAHSPSQWTIHHAYPGTDTAVLQQGNLYDCGVFVCTWADYIGRGKGFGFKEGDGENFRERLTYALFTSV